MSLSRGPGAMPEGLAGALHDGPPVEPRLSASVILVDGRRPWRLLLMRRPRDVDFAAGAYVFPGGSVHDEDVSFGDPIRSAALRELFEEVGVLLARSHGRPVRPSEVVRLRAELAKGNDWAAALRSCRLEPAFDRLTLYARWVTPVRVRKRFDTAFFLARNPAGAAIEPNPAEVAEHCWVTPADAVRDPNIPLVYATQQILASLAQETDASRLIARFRRRKRIAVVEPRIVETETGLAIVH